MLSVHKTLSTTSGKTHELSRRKLLTSLSAFAFVLHSGPSSICFPQSAANQMPGHTIALLGVVAWRRRLHTESGAHRFLYVKQCGQIPSENGRIFRAIIDKHDIHRRPQKYGSHCRHRWRRFGCENVEKVCVLLPFGISWLITLVALQIQCPKQRSSIRQLYLWSRCNAIVLSPEKSRFGPEMLRRSRTGGNVWPID